MRIVVGLSGGVDSSVAAFLLKEAGHEVIGMFMKNWHDDSVIIDDECPWIEDSNDALIVSEKLAIPFQVIDFSKEYKQRIVDYMFKEYKSGRTPNPDVLCNKEIKFDLFLKQAKLLGADMVATGHYCRKESIQAGEQTIYRLLSGKDNQKDQSYFLCQVNQQQLAQILFPIGERTKKEVREIAKREGLITAEKKDSQGLCFIGKVRLPDFLQQQLKPKKGKIIEIPPNAAVFEKNWESQNLEYLAAPYTLHPSDGSVIGEHKGAHYYTIGQRKGLHVGGSPLPRFIIGTDIQNNIIYVGQGHDHPGLNRKALFVSAKEVHWIREDLTMKEGEERLYQARIRYRQPVEPTTVFCRNEGLYFVFDHYQRGIAPGQFIAWYQEDELIGSGVIA